MANIYDDVELLQQQMATVYPQTLIGDTDLNTLAVGVYLIPNSTVCASLQNKPTSSNATGIIRVFDGGDSSQKTMHYIPCANVPTYYQRAYYLGEWTEWNTVDLVDTGWLDLTLVSTVVAYGTTQKPQYRRIGKQVFVRGVYLGAGTGITVGTTIATLPEGFRPSQRIMKYAPCYGMGVDRLEIETDGTIAIAQTTVTTANINHFHSFSDLSFVID